MMEWNAFGWHYLSGPFGLEKNYLRAPLRLYSNSYIICEIRNICDGSGSSFATFRHFYDQRMKGGSSPILSWFNKIFCWSDSSFTLVPRHSVVKLLRSTESVEYNFHTSTDCSSRGPSLYIGVSSLHFLTYWT